MHALKPIVTFAKTNARLSRRAVSMSNYFPAGTYYFYGYPAGETAGFLNKVPPTVEELVAARILSCAGPSLKVVSFAATNPPHVDFELLEKLGIPYADDSRDVILPKNIAHNLTGSRRNIAVMDALVDSIPPDSLIMAQPFGDKTLESLYQISSRLTTWLNDKSNLPSLISSEFLPTRFGSYQSGADFFKHRAIHTTPCVIKAALSSSGDGVYICHNDKDLRKTFGELRSFEGPIVVDQYVDVAKNYCVNFGVPHDTTQPIDLIGFNEQLTTQNGDFLGGTITTTRLPTELTGIVAHMMSVVLPTVRAMGWYGVGGLDVITDKSGRAYFIDGNFRINGTTAYHFLVKNSSITTPLVTFVGQFNGQRELFERAILPLAGMGKQGKIIQLIALSKHADVWNLNGALMYDNKSELKHRIEQVLGAGIQSATLSHLATTI